METRDGGKAIGGGKLTYCGERKKNGYYIATVTETLGLFIVTHGLPARALANVFHTMPEALAFVEGL